MSSWKEDYQKVKVSEIKEFPAWIRFHERQKRDRLLVSKDRVMENDLPLTHRDFTVPKGAIGFRTHTTYLFYMEPDTEVFLRIAPPDNFGFTTVFPD
jgi:hypothetical protein